MEKNKMLKIKYIVSDNVEGSLYLDRGEVSEVRDMASVAGQCHLIMKSGHVYLLPMSAEDLLKLIHS